MSRKGILAIAVSVTAAVAMVGVVVLTLFRSEEYAKLLPLVAGLSGMAGCFVALMEEDRV